MEFKTYMVEGVQEEKDAIAVGKAQTMYNLLTGLVRARTKGRWRRGAVHFHGKTSNLGLVDAVPVNK